MFIVRKKKWALLMAGLVLMGTIFTAQAYFESSQDYIFTVDILADKSVSALMGDEEQRIFVSSVFLAAAAENIEDVRALLEVFDSGTKVFLASSPASPFFISMYLFAPGHTWVFTGNTLFGQIVAGTMTYTMVPEAAEMVMSSLKSNGNIETYYQVSYTDIMMGLYSTWNVGPTIPPGSYTTAILNQRMATRSGPGTKYTEDLGTLPQDTSITLIETVTTNGTPWGMVEFYKKDGQKYRAYTGMKRINAFGPVAQGTLDYYEVSLSQATAVYYGPGYDYAQRKGTVPAGTLLQVYAGENGFYLCDYQSDGKWVRAYFPVI